MKTIPVIKTDRSVKKSRAEQERHMQWCSTCNQKPFAQQVQLLPSFSEHCELDT
jgi:hypothetical protein